MGHLRAGTVTNHVDGLVEIGLSEGVSTRVRHLGSRFNVVHQHFIELHYRCIGYTGVAASASFVN